MNRHLVIAAWVLWASTALAQGPRVDLAGQPLPAGALARIGSSQFAQPSSQPIGGMQFSPDGKYFVTFSRQGVRVWDPASGHLMFRQQDPSVSDVLFHPKNATMYFVGAKPTCWSWEPRKNQTRTIWDSEAHEATGGAISANGKQLAFTTLNSLHVIDLDKTEEPTTIAKSEEGYTNSLAYSPDGRYLAVGSPLRLRLYDCKTWKQTRSFNVLQPAAVAFRPDSKGLAVSGRVLAFRGQAQDPGLRLFQTEFEEDWPDFKTAEGAYMHVLASADRKALLGTRVDDKGVHLVRLDFDTGKELSTLKLKDEQALVAIDPTEKRVALFDGTIRMLDFKTGKNLLATETFPQMSSPAFVDRAGKILGCVTDDNAVHFWDIATGKVRHERRAINPTDKAIALSPGGKWITIWTDDAHRNFMLIEADTGNMLWQTNREPILIQAAYHSLAFTPDDRLLIETTADGDLIVWDPQTGKKRRQAFRNLTGAPITPSPDGRLFLHAATLFEVATGQLRHSFNENIRVAAFSANGKYLAMIKGTGLEVDVVTVGIHESRMQLSVAIELQSLALSADSRWIAAGDVDGSIHIWDPEGNLRHRFSGHTEAVNGLAFSEDGRRLVSTSEDRTALIWDLSKIPDRANAPPMPKDILQKSCWTWLRDRTGTNPGKAMAIFQSRPKETVAFFRANLTPSKPIAAEDARRWLAELASSDYATRLQAMKTLEAAGEHVEEMLRKSLSKDTSADTRRRIEQLLEKIDRYEENPDRLREVRAVEVLERIASADAQSLLKTWSEGPPPARLTREAKTALGRLQR